VKNYIVILFFLGVLSACATSDNELREGESSRSRVSSDCISQGSIRDYTVLDDANLIVTEGARRKYHVVLSRRAFGLRSTWHIGFRTPTGSVCGGFSEILVDDGFTPDTIRIDSIRRLTPEDEEDLLIRFGKKEPEIEQPRQPEEVEGAEVEELD
jgi:hypothetical protein